jgi:hypothetical protein
MAIWRGNGGSIASVDQADEVIVSVGQGGTGADTLEGAKTNLGIPTNITDLADVTVASPTNSQVLQFNGTQWVNATVAGSGTVTSVDMAVPTGLAVSGNPITGEGTLAVSYASGYAIPTTAKQTTWDSTTSTVSSGATNWNTAYGWGNHASAGYLTSASTLDASKLSGTIDGGTY